MTTTARPDEVFRIQLLEDALKNAMYRRDPKHLVNREIPRLPRRDDKHIRVGRAPSGPVQK